MSPSTLAVLVPTFNACALVEDHLRSMDSWIDLADEIVVVDSYSNDGTFERLQRAFAARPVRFFQHPRGLYESWNYGIQQASGEWLYISTVGDPITRDLLLHLRETALASAADVVIGSPEFIDEANNPLPRMYWAVTEIAQSFAQDCPCVLSPEAAVFLGVRHLYNSALLGSSSSNLYRTAHMKVHPFPTGYGMSGDAAWSMLHAFRTRFACTSMRGSNFRVHAKNHGSGWTDEAKIHNAVLDVALQTCATAGEKLAALRVPELARLMSESARCNRTLKQLRMSFPGPWYLYPKIWLARRERHRVAAQLESLINAGVELVRREHLAPIHSDRRTEP